MKEQNNKKGCGPLTVLLWILFFVFLTLKLTGSITWSWWLVTIPLWGCTAFAIICVCLVAIMKFLASLNGD